MKEKLIMQFSDYEETGDMVIVEHRDSSVIIKEGTNVLVMSEKTFKKILKAYSS